MDKRERELLAADIARRVRLLCVQQLPKSVLDLMRESQYWQYPLYAINPPNAGSMRMIKRAGALHIEFEIDGNTVAWFRFDEDPER
jgi:hypothetical protein